MCNREASCAGNGGRMRKVRGGDCHTLRSNAADVSSSSVISVWQYARKFSFSEPLALAPM